MRLGLVKTSLIDYPELVSCVLFYPGCNLRCPYCHNPELALGMTPEDGVDMDDIRRFFEKRSSVLDGVVITGGEPTMHGSLQQLIDLAKQFGLRVKLDTNGLRPEVLGKLENIDFIAMDVKTSPSKYAKLLSGDIRLYDDTETRIVRSIDYIIASGIRHQFRTTLLQEIVNETDMNEICALIKGCREYRLTSFKPGNTLKEAYSGDISPAYLEEMRIICREYEIPMVFA